MTIERLRIVKTQIRFRDLDCPNSDEKEPNFMIEVSFPNLPVVTYFSHLHLWPKVTGDEALETFLNLKATFAALDISDGSEVIVLYNDDGKILAIGAIGTDAWIDTNDNYKIKSFKDLNIIITSLKVY